MLIHGLTLSGQLVNTNFQFLCSLLHDFCLQSKIKLKYNLNHSPCTPDSPSRTSTREGHSIFTIKGRKKWTWLFCTYGLNLRLLAGPRHRTFTTRK
jgi:hypothetical protein